jgi:CheY-like chemotaxis protein
VILTHRLQDQAIPKLSMRSRINGEKIMTNMTDVAKLLEGFATLAWPAIIIIVICLFKPKVAELIESAKSRKFTLKIGGQELTMEEASEQQRTIIADLQAQVIEIQKRIEGRVQPIPAPSEKVKAIIPPVARSILWVDDRPKNNSYFVQQLSDKGINVDLALSTTEGLRLFEKKNYGVIISDMGRTENGEYKATVGLELLQRIRDHNKTIPFIIFSSSRAAREYQDKARSLGATLITSSPTEMFGILQTVLDYSLA